MPFATATTAVPQRHQVLGKVRGQRELAQMVARKMARAASSVDAVAVIAVGMPGAETAVVVAVVRVAAD